MHVLSGWVATLSAGGLVALAIDESARPSEAAIPILAVVLVFSAIVWFLTREHDDAKGGPAVASSRVQAIQDSTAGRDQIQVGRDQINITHSASAAPLGPARAERFRAVRDEINHIKRRFRQLEENCQLVGSLWPTESVTPYQVLPSEKWNAHGAALRLPDVAHDTIQEAYELANDFNHLMQRGPRTVGDAEPDLEGLKAAFDRAEAVLKREQAAAASHGNPFAQATELKKQFADKDLRIAMREVTEAELANLVRPRLEPLIERRATSMQLATAQWSKHEPRGERDARRAAEARSGRAADVRRSRSTATAPERMR